MQSDHKVNILLVDDQLGKLMSYEVVLQGLGANLIKATSATEALGLLLKNDFALVLVDVCMPDFDGFQLAKMIREHPRFEQTAIIFISAVQISEIDHVQGYALGAVDYVPVPVVPEVLRAKVQVFVDLYRNRLQLERLNRELEARVAERTAELEKSHRLLVKSEQRRTLALAAGRMGSWDWDLDAKTCVFDEGQCAILGVIPKSFIPTQESIQRFFETDDWARLMRVFDAASATEHSFQTEIEIRRPNGERRWCILAAAASFDLAGRLMRVTGITIDITDRKEAEERQSMLAREVDHRARNMLAVVQAIIRLTRSSSTSEYVAAVEGRIRALSQTHSLLSDSHWIGADVERLVREELAPYVGSDSTSRLVIKGPKVSLPPEKAQTVGLALHELATNAAKYGSLSSEAGGLEVAWSVEEGRLRLIWKESGGPKVNVPTRQGFGSKIINSSAKASDGGEALFEWNLEGLRFTLVISLAPTPRTAAGASVGRNESRPVLLPHKPENRRQILLVEDEPLVGMVMRSTLEEAGFVVIGPIMNLDEAIEVADTQQFDTAILDVNIGGELVYPLAELLSIRKIPFVFMTGYDDAAIEPAFRDVLTLQKPLDEVALMHILGSAVPSASSTPQQHIAL
jgi:two-component sensor histidine kinase/CheY-like chemotaxis protein